MAKYTRTDSQGVVRCWWCTREPIYIEYHDLEWGVPTRDDRRLFEKICLEGFQAGLSWLTILKKRVAFRKAFKEFDFHKVASFSARDSARLLGNPDIVRHRGKIEATVNNARRAIEAVERVGSLEKLFWQFEPPRQPRFDARRAVSEESKAMSRELKKLGWAFVGPTTCYSFMQAMGLVNDHHPRCHRFELVRDA